MPALRPAFSRLMGLETEYAIRFSPSAPDSSPSRPGNDRVYRAIVRAVAEQVHASPGDGAPAKDQIFVQNGGAFYYEHVPHCPSGGLLESATPECRTPAQLLLYQRAQETLLLRALERAQRRLRATGADGELGLVKNCRDAEDNVYGAQENYEVEVARGGWLVAYRAGLVLLLPLIALQTLLAWGLQILIALVVILLALLGLALAVLVPRWRAMRRLAALLEADEHTLGRLFGRLQLWLAYALMGPVATPYALLLELTAFRHLRAPLLAFFASRSLIAGAGSVDGEGRFALAEKAPAVRRVLRRSISPEGRPIFDTGNLIKQAVAPMSFRFAPLCALFRRRQRLQLGFGDSNAAQVAEYLKIASTALMLDLAEAGALADAPRLRRPLAALHAVAADATLEAELELCDGSRRSALDLQRFYLERAEAHLASSASASLEAREALALWRRMLGALEARDWQALVGKLDWVTKRYLLESCGKGDSAVLKTIDLRYHELGAGYLARLERAGLAPAMVADEEVERAIEEPPAGGPAFLRGELIRRRARSRLPLKVSWQSAWIGGRFHGRVVHFDPARARRVQGPQI